VALDDDHARVLIDHLTLTGQRVPRHVSVFSGDSTPGGFQSVPPLTGIQYGRDAAHRLLVEQFIEIVEARSSADKIVLPPPAVQLVEGQSCRAWKGKLP
jgi:DNA-binding LacI/PurR family transcriptional regulator